MGGRRPNINVRTKGDTRYEGERLAWSIISIDFQSAGIVSIVGEWMLMKILTIENEFPFYNIREHLQFLERNLWHKNGSYMVALLVN